MKPFKLPKKFLGDLDAEVAAKLVVASADVALIVDGKGVIRDLALDSRDLVQDGFESWIGRPWIDTVTVESRAKIEEMIAEASAKHAPRWRQVNHPTQRGRDVPVRYIAIDLGRSDGRLIAVGRDLRAMSALQQQLLTAQQQMEREYARLRQVEMRFRALFQMTTEPVLVLDASTYKVIEANPAATRVILNGGRKLVGRNLYDLFEPGSNDDLQSLMAQIRTSPRADDITVRIGANATPYGLSASMFRQDAVSYVLIRLTPSERRAAADDARIKSAVTIQKVIGSLPDAFVVVDMGGVVLTANAAFLQLTELAAEEQVKGQPISRWMGRSGVDFDVLRANLRENDTVHRFNTVVMGELGTREEVELSAVAIASGQPPCIGLLLRRRDLTATRPLAESPTSDLTRSVEQMTKLVGQVPLRDLVREATDIIERMCIEAALQLTRDNRASAAEILGLSRQSLYMKLRRYGLSDHDPESAG